MSSELQIYLRDVTPYEFFRYHQAESFYGKSLSLQGMQIDATLRGADKIVGAISSQNYYLSAGIEATNRVYRAIESQSTVLQDINASIGRNTAAVARVGSILMEQNSILNGIGAGIARGNAIASEQLSVQLGIAQMVAQANGIDITEVLPQYFPKPPLLKPPTIPERIKAAKTRIDLSALTMDLYQRMFGEEEVLKNKATYMILTDEQLEGLNPSGIVEGMVFDAYKRGRHASNDLVATISEYDGQLNLIEQVIDDTVTTSRAKALLGEVKDTIWKDPEAAILPVIVDLNYATVPEMDREVIAGYQLLTPPRYSPAEQSVLFIAVNNPVWLEHYPSTGTTVTRTSEEALVVDGEKDTAFFLPRLYQSGWAEQQRTVAGGKERFLVLPYTIFSKPKGHFQRLAEPKEVSVAVRDSQAVRILKGKLPQDLKVVSDAILPADQQRVKETRKKLNAVLQQRKEYLKKCEKRIEELKRQVEQYRERPEIDTGKRHFSFWERLLGVPHLVEEERERFNMRISLHSEIRNLEWDIEGLQILLSQDNGYGPARWPENLYKKGMEEIKEVWNLEKSLKNFPLRRAKFIVDRDALLAKEQEILGRQKAETEDSGKTVE